MKRLLLLLFILSLAAHAQAQVPKAVSYQGVLRDTGGSLVPDGSYDITFRIYNVSTGGSALWTEAQSVQVSKGVFNAVLGSVTLLDLDFDVQYWLGITVGAGSEMTPRTPLTTSPYAFRAEVADSLAGGGAADDGDWTITGADMYSAVPGNVGIGTTTPARKLEVAGEAAVGGGLFGRGSGIGLRTSSGGYGVWVRSGGQVGLRGQSYWGGLAPGWGPDVHVNTGGDTAYVWIGGNIEDVGALTGHLAFVGQPSGMMGPAQLSSIGGMIAGSGPLACGNLLFYTASGSLPETYPERMRLTYQGRLGIGITNPAEMLDIAGALRLATTTSSNAGTIRWTGSDFEGYDGIEWKSLTTAIATDPDWTISGDDMYSAVAGNIGIGTVTPEEKLQVIGRINSKDSEQETTALEIWGETDGGVIDMIGATPGSGLSVRTDGADRLFIQNDGMIGIGGALAFYRLNILSSGNNDAKVRLEGDPDDDPSISFQDGPLSQRAEVGWDASDEALKLKAEASIDGEMGINVKGGGFVGIGTAWPSYALHVIGDIFATGTIYGNVASPDDGDWTVSGSYIYPSSATNVGVGTTSPDEELSVVGVVRGSFDATETEYVEMSHGGGNGYINWNGDGNLDFRYGGAARVSITQTGELGIGTTTPAYDLTVNGDAGFNDFLYHNGDANTYLKFDTDKSAIFGGGKNLLELDGVNNRVIVNNDGNDVDFRVESSTSQYALFVQGSNGYIGVGTSTPGALLDVNGTTRTDVLEVNGTDLAEPFEITDGQLEPGSVVVIDDENPGRLTVTDRPYDKRVAGVISGAGGVRPGLKLRQEGRFDAGQDVALTGRVMVLCDASFGAIEPGDRLTTSSIPGYAMRVAEDDRAPGAVIGKAMTALKSGKGLVLLLVQPQ